MILVRGERGVRDERAIVVSRKIRSFVPFSFSKSKFFESKETSMIVRKPFQVTFFPFFFFLFFPTIFISVDNIWV